MSNATFVQLSAHTGENFEAYLSTPARANGAGLVILPEVYNVNHWVRAVADSYAADGFTVLVPDLFWRQQPGVYLDYDEPDRARAQGEEVDVDGVVSDVGQAAAYLRAQLGDQAKVGVIGFCLGGRLAVLAGIRERLDAVIGYYAVKLDQHLAELPELEKPTLLHFGETDPWVPQQTQESVGAILADRANVDLQIYPGTGHGFARNGYPPYNADATAVARQRSNALLATLT
ncbi:dienelactone hydrolase family protein [Tardiphaga robiniae]|uniref:Dienelactone hydrolase family protein n=1 Tax=Tardiphaga robiniae TaxID=943830 RepID=A0A7G6TXG5_9BRAD|nr:dienelactone hydrolase family protein [Tardiphaga robiniae]QND71447.1 dienelactone hydrolase family protein [Tardiphaga robiniae]